MADISSEFKIHVAMGTRLHASCCKTAGGAIIVSLNLWPAISSIDDSAMNATS